MKLSQLKKLTKAFLTKSGGELLNPKPLLVPDPGRESIEEKIARMIKTNEVMQDTGYETYEESNDFDVNNPFDNHLERELARYDIIEDEELSDIAPQRVQEPEIVDPKRSGMVLDETNPSPPHPKLGGEDLSDPPEADPPPKQ